MPRGIAQRNTAGLTSMSDRSATHEVLNQSPPYADIDLFTSDCPLADAVAGNGAGTEPLALRAFGRHWGTAQMFQLGGGANEEPPKLPSFRSRACRRDRGHVEPA